MRHVAMFVWTAGYSGLVPIAPGTAGSVVGLVLVLSARLFEHLWVEPIVVLIVVAGGVWSANKAEVYYKRKDPGQVVIDEVAGMVLTMLWIDASMEWMAVGFLLFRCFDIVKPFPVNKIEQVSGGWGVIGDDLAAGLYANCTLRILMWLSGVSPAWSACL